MIRKIWYHLFPKRCKRCGRILTTAKSRKTGYGPLCAVGGAAAKERMLLEEAGQTSFLDKDYETKYAQGNEPRAKN